MAIFQAFNKRNDSWVKYRKEGTRTTILDVKEKKAHIPFKGVKMR